METLEETIEKNGIDAERTWARKMDDIDFTRGLEAEKDGREG